MALQGTESAMASLVKDMGGFPSVTPEMIALCKGVIDEVLTGVATYGNMASGHKISSLEGDAMGDSISLAMGKESQDTIKKIGQAICEHISSSGVVTYAGPPPSATVPPPKAWFTGGVISGLVGQTVATLVQSKIQCPMTPQLIGMCTGITTHIMQATVVTKGVLS